MKRLYGLETNEISLVPRGANKKKFLVFKSEEKQMEDSLEKGGPGSGPQSGSGGRHSEQAQQARRIANRERTNASQGKFDQRSSAIRAGQQARRDRVTKNNWVAGTTASRAASRRSASKKSLDEMNQKEKDKMAKTMGAVGKESGDMAPRADSAVHKEPYDPNKPMPHEDGASYNAPLDERAQAALKAMARIAAPHKGVLKPEHVAMAMKEAGLHDGAGEESEDEDKDEIALEMQMPMDVEEEHHAAALGKAKKKAMKAYKKALSKLGYRKYPDEQQAVKADEAMDEDRDEGEIGKSGVSKENNQEESVSKQKSMELSGFNESQKRQLTDVFKAYDERTKELVKKNDELAAELKRRDESEKHREYVAKADSLSHLGIPKEEIVETLADAARMGEKAYTRVVKQYETLNAQAEKGGLFNEIGSRGGSPTGDFDHRINALVDSVVQKSDGTRTRAEIYDQVIQSKEGQNLYAEYKNGRKGGA